MPLTAFSTLPPILAGQDVIAQAKTGSGKTAAFGIGLLSRLVVSCFSVQRQPRPGPPERAPDQGALFQDSQDRVNLGKGRAT